MVQQLHWMVENVETSRSMLPPNNRERTQSAQTTSLVPSFQLGDTPTRSSASRVLEANPGNDGLRLIESQLGGICC